MINDDISYYLGREVKVITNDNKEINGVLIKDGSAYTFSLQNEPKLKAEDIKKIYYLKS